MGQVAHPSPPALCIVALATGKPHDAPYHSAHQNIRHHWLVIAGSARRQGQQGLATCSTSLARHHTGFQPFPLSLLGKSQGSHLPTELGADRDRGMGGQVTSLTRLSPAAGLLSWLGQLVGEGATLAWQWAGTIMCGHGWTHPSVHPSPAPGAT